MFETIVVIVLIVSGILYIYNHESTSQSFGTSLMKTATFGSLMLLFLFGGHPFCRNFTAGFWDVLRDIRANVEHRYNGTPTNSTPTPSATAKSTGTPSATASATATTPTIPAPTLSMATVNGRKITLDPPPAGYFWNWRSTNQTPLRLNKNDFTIDVPTGTPNIDLYFEDETTGKGGGYITVSVP